MKTAITNEITIEIWIVILKDKGEEQLLFIASQI